MTDNQCAFIRWQWFDTAKKHLNNEERLLLYETVFAYQFEDAEPELSLPPMVGMLFDLIKPVLTADKEKMRKRQETARANGASGGRPKINRIGQEVTKPSGLNENQVGFFGLANTMFQYPNTNANNNVCVNAPEINSEDTHTKFLVCTEFFLMGVTDPIDEAKLFWAYYDARGWKTTNGQPVANIVALAKSWHPKNLTMSIAKQRQPLKSLLNLVENPDFSLFERLLRVVVDNSLSEIVLFVPTQNDAVYLEERHINALSRWVKSVDGRSEQWQLQYHFEESV